MNPEARSEVETAEARPSIRRLDAVVVGAGVSGMYMLHELRRLGLKTRVYEAGSGVGGTWFWNCYPGAHCDVESLEYSFSFSEELQQEWTWSERYAGQSEILRYLNHVADRFDLRKDIQFDTKVVSAIFDDRSNLWSITTSTGERIEARFCMMATGPLSLVNIPKFKGLEDFRGKWYHTGIWPKEGVDFTGLRVGVVGTGSSGIQLIPKVAQQAKELFVFQRTANFCVPAHNRELAADVVEKYKAIYPERRRAAAASPYGMAGYPMPDRKAMDDSPQERLATYEARWARGGAISFLSSYMDLLTDKDANQTACEFVRGKIREIVHDRDVADLLCPNDHYIGTKRLCLGNHYFETYNRSNVKLVDARKSPIQEITPSGIRTSKQVYELDAIAFATGFDAMTGALFDIDIRGSNGVQLRTEWADGARTYLGLMAAGFPNMFMLAGPGGPATKANVVPVSEHNVNWIIRCLRYLRANGIDRVEATPEAEAGWMHHLKAVADSTLYPLANSWYLGANIPGKPRVFTTYLGGVNTYFGKCDAAAANGYEGFLLDSHVPAMAK